MDEEHFNMQVRKFLKQVGVTSQREIEKAVRVALYEGRLKPDATVKAKVTLSLPSLDVTHEIEALIELEGDDMSQAYRPGD